MSREQQHRARQLRRMVAGLTPEEQEEIALWVRGVLHIETEQGKRVLGDTDPDVLLALEIVYRIARLCYQEMPRRGA